MNNEHERLELIENIVRKHSDDIAVSIARSFERLEERIDAVEARFFSRIADLEDKGVSLHNELGDTIAEVKEEIRNYVLSQEKEPETKEVKCICNCGNTHMTAKE